jgi:hypothetical protein
MNRIIEREVVLKNFGKLVAELRNKTTVDNPDKGTRLLTQKGLALRTENKLGVEQIREIEDGTRAKLSPEDVHILATAFDLTEIETSEFFIAAGFVYPRPIDPPEPSRMKLLLTMHRFPAVAMNRLGDVLALNSYAIKLYSLDRDRLIALDSGPLGPNMLRMQFEEQFNVKRNHSNNLDLWEAEIVRNIRALRAESFRYQATTRYRQIYAELEKFPNFKHLWERAGKQNRDGLLIEPKLEAHHPDFGHLRFLVTRFPHGYISSDTIFTVLSPINLTDEAQIRLRDAVEEIEVHEFKPRPLG